MTTSRRIGSGLIDESVEATPVDMSVLDIAATDVVTADRNDSFSEVAATMAEEEVGCVVIEEEAMPVGVVTDRKLALAMAEDPEAGHRTVDEEMTREVRTIPDDADVYEAVQILSDIGARRAPVVDDDRELEGLLSIDDVLHFVEEELDEAEDVIEQQSPRMD